MPTSTFPIDSPNGVQLSPTTVTLADGTSLDLAGLDIRELHELHWQQEREFARQIRVSEKASPERQQATQTGYDTVTRILSQLRTTEPGPLAMGWDQRYARLVLDLLARQRSDRDHVELFEIGYGAGHLLRAAHDAGYEVGGIEVAAAMRDQALENLGAGHEPRLLYGDFLTADFEDHHVAPTLVYWNDVFEHIHPDEIHDYLRRIYELLRPGGALVTITPNWHFRPSDVTALHLPPRSEPVGFHLREYTLCDVTRLLLAVGFNSVATPAFVGKRRIMLCGSGAASLKRAVEPGLEWLPYRAARFICRRAGLSMTIATKHTALAK